MRKAKKIPPTFAKGVHDGVIGHIVTPYKLPERVIDEIEGKEILKRKLKTDEKNAIVDGLTFVIEVFNFPTVVPSRAEIAATLSAIANLKDAGEICAAYAECDDTSRFHIDNELYLHLGKAVPRVTADEIAQAALHASQSLPASRGGRPKEPWRMCFADFVTCVWQRIQPNGIDGDDGRFMKFAVALARVFGDIEYDAVLKLMTQYREKTAVR